MAAEPGDSKTAQESGKTNRLASLIIVALLMGGEGAGIFFLAKAVSTSPAKAVAQDVIDTEPLVDKSKGDELAEVEMAECRPSNKISGKFITFHIRVSALVASDHAGEVEKLVRSKRARIEDGVNTVIRSAAPKQFTEPGLETIKRRLKQEFDRILGDDQIVKSVLIPQMLQSGPGV